MGILDEDYDIWTGKKRKKSKGNNYNGGILGSVPSIFGDSKRSRRNSSGFNLWGDPFQNERKLHKKKHNKPVDKEIEREIINKVVKDSKRDNHRSLSASDKQILFNKANYRCQNPYCHTKGRKLIYSELTAGHGDAWSKGGPTTPENSVALCYACQRMQSTKTWKEFLYIQKNIGRNIKNK